MFTSKTQVHLTMFTHVIVRFSIKCDCSILKESKVRSPFFLTISGWKLEATNVLLTVKFQLCNFIFSIHSILSL